MEYLKRDENGRVRVPTFPKLKAQLNEAKEEVEHINTVVLPAMREQGFGSNVGINILLILTTTQSRALLPDIPKRTLNYGKYIGFNGRACFFKEKAFMEDYDKTPDGKIRLLTLREFEQVMKEARENYGVER